MAYYRKNKRRFDPRYFLSERMEEELEEYVVGTDPSTVGSSNIVNLPSANNEEKKEKEKEVEEGCGEPVENEVDIGDLAGDEAFGVGWNAALDRISSMIGELIDEMGAEDEDADPVGDMAGEPLPQLVGEPHLEE